MPKISKDIRKEQKRPQMTCPENIFLKICQIKIQKLYRSTAYKQHNKGNNKTKNFNNMPVLFK